MDIKQIQEKIVGEQDYNKLNDILKLAIEQNDIGLQAKTSLRNIFKYLQKNGSLNIAVQGNTINQFLKKKYEVYQEILLKQVGSLDQLIDSLRSSCNDVNQLKNEHIFKRFVSRVLYQMSSDHIEFCQQYLYKYADLASVFFDLAAKENIQNLPSVYEFLKYVEFDENEEELFFQNEESLVKKIKVSTEYYKPLVEAHSVEEWRILRKQNFTNFITSIVHQLQGQDENVKSFLRLVNKHIVDKIENPLIIANFIQHHFDNDESVEIKVQALQTLFILVGKCQFNYDGFYEKLEQLISLPKMFECEETPRFMKLLYTACRSSKVPETQLYSIIKRVLQNTIQLPPHRQLWTVSFVFNLVKKHQTLKKYLQNLDSENQSEEHYWELQIFQNHYLSDIKQIVKMMGDDMEKLDFIDLDAISQLNFDDLIETQFIKLKDVNSVI